MDNLVLLKEAKIVTTPLIELEISSRKNIYQNLFSGGKGLRASLTQQVASLLHIPQEQKERLSQIVEYIHQSSLLHDDVIDASPTRRGQLSGWRQYSMKKAVLAGDYLLAEAAESTAHLQNIPLMKLTAHTLKQLVKGEWLQAEIRDQEKAEDLEKVHELKTASLFQWSLKAPFLLKNHYDQDLHSQLDEIGRLMGLLFQRADDLLDFDIRNQEGKTIFKDLEEESLNSFAVHLLQILEGHMFNQVAERTLSRPQKINKKKTNQSLALKSCRSLKAVQKLVGTKIFEQALADFDKDSQQKIKVCQNKIEHLGKSLLHLSSSLKDKPFPPKRVKGIINTLKKWPRKLYWRK